MTYLRTDNTTLRARRNAREGRDERGWLIDPQSPRRPFGAALTASNGGKPEPLRLVTEEPRGLGRKTVAWAKRTIEGGEA